jgi:hypothetical protein
MALDTINYLDWPSDQRSIELADSVIEQSLSYGEFLYGSPVPRIKLEAVPENGLRNRHFDPTAQAQLFDIAHDRGLYPMVSSIAQSMYYFEGPSNNSGLLLRLHEMPQTKWDDREVLTVREALYEYCGATKEHCLRNDVEAGDPAGMVVWRMSNGFLLIESSKMGVDMQGNPQLLRTLSEARADTLDEALAAVNEFTLQERLRIRHTLWQLNATNDQARRVLEGASRLNVHDDYDVERRLHQVRRAELGITEEPLNWRQNIVSAIGRIAAFNPGRRQHVTEQA